MNDNEILAELSTIFRKVLDDPDIVLTSEKTADDIENWDLLNHILIIVEVERHFGIKFQAAEMEELKNVGELVELIASRLTLSGR